MALRDRQDDDGGTASKANLYEAQMVAKTVEYLLLQGYQPDQVNTRWCVGVGAWRPHK